MNSTRVPVTQSFCLGVWRKTGKLRYELNHFALGFDTSGNFVARLKLLQEVAGKVTAIRTTVDSTVNQVF